LQQNTRYVMKTWGKTPTWEEVLFVHFLRAGNQTYKQPTVQLKDMLPTDFYIFKQADGSELRGKMKALCLVRADTEARITFAELLKQSTAAPAQPVEPVVVEPAAEAAAEEPATEAPVEVEAAVTEESPAADINEELLLSNDETDEAQVEAVATAPEGESKEDRKRRLDRERKAEKRRQAKEAFTALVTAPGDDAAQAAA
jgi:hypothetical protein